MADLPTWAANLPAFPPTPGFRFSFDDEPTPESDPELHPEVQHIAVVEKSIGYCFSDRRLLKCALTSPGWINQHGGSLMTSGKYRDNRALEWLGDAILYRLITERMVWAGAALTTGKSTPARSNLVSNSRLATVGEQLGLWPHLFLDDGERINNAVKGRPTFLSNAVEAVLGAVYVDAACGGDGDGWGAVRELVDRLLPDDQPGSDR